jgi:uncharacterized protein involved in type VI secretion and phage assembly
MADMRTTYLMIFALCLAGAGALAQQPSISSQTPAQPQQSSTSEPAIPAAAPADAAKTSATTAATPAASTESADAAKAAADAEAKAKAQEKRMRGRGYKPSVRNGTTMWCRKETELGSHFAESVCGTADDIDRTEQAAKDATTDMQNHVTNPQRY